LRSVHQNVGGRIARIGIEQEVEFEVVLVANDRDVVALGPTHQLEPEHPVEGQGAVEIAHPNADVIDLLDSDPLGHCHLPCFCRLLDDGRRRSLGHSPG